MTADQALKEYGSNACVAAYNYNIIDGEGGTFIEINTGIPSRHQGINPQKQNHMKTKQEKQPYKFEVTDTFGGEANYCWKRTHTFEAVSLHGALCMLSRTEGLNFRSVGCDRFDAMGACICAFHLDE